MLRSSHLKALQPGLYHGHQRPFSPLLLPVFRSWSEHIQSKEARNTCALPALHDRIEVLFPNRLCWDLWIPEELWCRRSDSTLLNRKCFCFTSQELCFVSFLMQAEAPMGQLLHTLWPGEEVSQLYRPAEYLIMILQNSFPRDRCELLNATCWEVQQLRNSCKCPLLSSHSRHC